MITKDSIETTYDTEGSRCALNDAGILSKLCLPNKKPLPFRGGVGGEASLEVERPVSHAAGSAQRCSQCGEDTYQYLNHHLPF